MRVSSHTHDPTTTDLQSVLHHDLNSLPSTRRAHPAPTRRSTTTTWVRDKDVPHADGRYLLAIVEGEVRDVSGHVCDAVRGEERSAST